MRMGCCIMHVETGSEVIVIFTAGTCQNFTNGKMGPGKLGTKEEGAA